MSYQISLKTPRHCLLFACMFFIALTSLVQAQNLPTPIRTVQGITEYRLPNGMQVLLFPDDTKPTMTVNVTIRVGSKHENYGETGMAHLLEHLVFKGTPTHPNIPQVLNQYGMRFNGTTYFDRTNYFESFNASDEALRVALALEADRLVNSYIARKDLDSEMTVVRNELERGENSAGRVLYQRVLSAMFTWHNYGKATIGAVSDVENVDIARLQQFYKLYYQPDNATLVVAGRIDPVKTWGMINETFGKIAPADRVKNPLPKLYTKEDTQDGEREVMVRRVGEVPAVMASYHTVGGAHPDVAVLTILQAMLGDEPSGRLYKQLNETKLATESYAWLNILADSGILTFGASVPKNSKTDAVKAALIAAIETNGKDGKSLLTGADLQRAKTELQLAHEKLMQNPEQIAVGLSDSIGRGDWRLLFAENAKIQAVTLNDINRVAKLYLTAANRTVGVYVPTEAPQRAKIEPAPNPTAVADAATYAPTVAAGERFDPTPQTLESRTQRKSVDFGAKINNKTDKVEFVTLAKQNRGNTVSLKVRLRFGSVNSVKSGEGAGLLGAWLQEGSKTLDKQAIQDKLRSLKASISMSSAPQGLEVNIKTEAAYLNDSLKLVAELITQPAFKADAFERLRLAALTDRQSRLGEPDTIVGDTYAAHANAARGFTAKDRGHLDYQLSTAEGIAALQALKPAAVQALYLKAWSAKNAQVSIVGTISPAEIAQIENTIKTSFAAKNSGAAWSASPAAATLVYQRHDAPAVTLPALNVQKKLADKANATYQAVLPIKIGRDDADYWNLQLANHILGSSGLNSRIEKRVRGTEGLSYSAGAQLSIATYNDTSAWVAEASFAPANLKKVQTGIREEVARALKDGLTDAEVAEAKQSMLQNLQSQRSRDAYLAGHVLYQQDRGKTFALHTQHEVRINAATTVSVNAALRKFIKADGWVEIAAGSF